MATARALFACALTLSALLVAASSALGGVVVEVDGATYSASGSTSTYSVTIGGGTEPNITIVFTARVTTLVNVRIYDSVTGDGLIGTQPGAVPPAAGIGRLVIEGNASATGRLNLLIADKDQVFPPDGNVLALSALTPGLTTLGGTLVAGSGSGGGCSHDYDAHPWATVNTLSTDDRPQFPVSGWSNANLRGIIIENPSLRRQTVLAAVVSGDICPGYNEENPSRGRIEVGQVLRLAALGEQQSEGVLYGNINADVVAVAQDEVISYDLCNPAGINSPQRTGFRAIESVSAGNAIRGDVLAWGRTRDDAGGLYERKPDVPVETPNCTISNLEVYPLWINRGSIFNVRIGPGLGAKGFYGSIESRLGRIYSVRTTGEIVGSQIKAADGVLEVRIHKWDANGDGERTALAKALAVGSIDAHFGTTATFSSVQKVGNDPGDDYETTLAKARQQGAIHLIETKGTFSGSVMCNNLIDDGTAAHRDALGRAGIIVWDHKGVDGSTVPRVYPGRPGGLVSPRHSERRLYRVAPCLRAPHR